MAASILASRGFKVQDVDKGFVGICVSAPKLTTMGEVREGGEGREGRKGRGGGGRREGR